MQLGPREFFPATTQEPGLGVSFRNREDSWPGCSFEGLNEHPSALDA